MLDSGSASLRCAWQTCPMASRKMKQPMRNFAFQCYEQHILEVDDTRRRRLRSESSGSVMETAEGRSGCFVLFLAPLTGDDPLVCSVTHKLTTLKQQSTI